MGIILELDQREDLIKDIKSTTVIVCRLHWKTSHQKK